jgi:hypothetical protein
MIMTTSLDDVQTLRNDLRAKSREFANIHHEVFYFIPEYPTHNDEPMLILSEDIGYVAHKDSGELTVKHLFDARTDRPIFIFPDLLLCEQALSTIHTLTRARAP